MYEEILNDIAHYFDDKTAEEVDRFFEEVNKENAFDSVSAKDFFDSIDRGSRISFNSDKDNSCSCEDYTLNANMEKSHYISGNFNLAA